jgi:hypothetical protein
MPGESTQLLVAHHIMEESAMAISFPAEWRLSHNEEAVLARLALSETPVPYAELDAVLAPTRRGKVGRPFKVLLHYLRRKLMPHGVTIITRKGIGFALTVKSKALIADASSAEQAACRRMHELSVARLEL